MAVEVIDTREHPKSRMHEIFPTEDQAMEFISRKGLTETPGILVRTVDKTNFFSVIREGGKEQGERRVKKNITEEEAKKYAKDKNNLKASVNDVQAAMTPMVES